MPLQTTKKITKLNDKKIIYIQQQQDTRFRLHQYLQLREILSGEELHKSRNDA
jgi:hypothetical protein